MLNVQVEQVTENGSKYMRKSKIIKIYMRRTDKQIIQKISISI